jgi:hypothetical protein
MEKYQIKNQIQKKYFSFKKLAKKIEVEEAKKSEDFKNKKHKSKVF